MTVPVFFKVDKSDDSFSLQGRKFSEGDSARLENVTEIDGYTITITLNDLGYVPKLGDVDGLEAVSVRYKKGNIQIFLLYENAEKTALSACCKTSNCECYASVACFCQELH